jgi:hypothetical protein
MLVWLDHSLRQFEPASVRSTSILEQQQLRHKTSTVPSCQTCQLNTTAVLCARSALRGDQFIRRNLVENSKSDTAIEKCGEPTSLVPWGWWMQMQWCVAWKRCARSYVTGFSSGNRGPTKKPRRVSGSSSLPPPPPHPFRSRATSRSATTAPAPNTSARTGMRTSRQWAVLNGLNTLGCALGWC